MINALKMYIRDSRNLRRCETGLEDHQSLHEYTRIPTFCHVASIVGKSSCGSSVSLFRSVGREGDCDVCFDFDFVPFLVFSSLRIADDVNYRLGGYVTHA